LYSDFTFFLDFCLKVIYTICTMGNKKKEKDPGFEVKCKKCGTVTDLNSIVKTCYSDECETCGSYSGVTFWCTKCFNEEEVSK